MNLCHACKQAHHEPESDVMRICCSVPIQTAHHFLFERRARNQLSIHLRPSPCSSQCYNAHRDHYKRLLKFPNNHLRPTSSLQTPQPQPTTSLYSLQSLQPLLMLQHLHHKRHSPSSTSQQPLQTTPTTVSSLDAHHSL